MPEDLEFVQEVILPTTLTQGRWSGDFRFRHQHTNEAIDVNYNQFVVTNPTSGTPVAFATVTRDVRERKRIEAEIRALNQSLERRVEERTVELQRTNAELARSNAELERFAFVASHDLQEPLRSIASFTEVLNRKYGDTLDDRGREYLRFVTGGAERMKTLIDDLLVFSRLNAVHEAFGQADTGEALGEALSRLHASVERTDARIIHDTLPVLRGAPGELVQLFQNLIGNAIKFRREGVQPEVRIGARLDDGVWHFWVADNGIGIDPQYHERVFGLFQRLHVREKYEGTGLGLAIVRKIVERHGGQVWLESRVGRGTTVHFTLRGPQEVDGD
jgi:light-regulated signal transduction histidine kinase (bacteriophytochrome)